MSKAFIQTASLKIVTLAKALKSRSCSSHGKDNPPPQCSKFKAEMSLKHNHWSEALSQAFPHCHQGKAQPCRRPSATWGCSEQGVTALEWSPWDGWSPPREQCHWQAHDRQKAGDHALWDCQQDRMIHCGPTRAACSYLLEWAWGQRPHLPPWINREKTYLPRQGWHACPTSSVAEKRGASFRWQEHPEALAEPNSQWARGGGGSQRRVQHPNQQIP